jgi:hypothetical protein
MHKKLNDYVKIYNNWFDDDLCVKTIQELEKRNWQKNKFYTPTNELWYSPSGENDFDVLMENNISTSNEISERMWYGYEKYIKDLNFQWFSGWNGFSGVNYNRYKQNEKMALHCDHIHSIFDGEIKGVPTMTALGVLNDDYEGGEFIMWEDEIIKLKQGDILVFPSNFLYPHSVNMIKSGIRYTCVCWAF